MTPSAGAGTSRTTLSVSRSARFSSRLNASPGCLCQATRVASAMDSGNAGTRISMLIKLSRHSLAVVGALAGAGQGGQTLGLARGVLLRRGMQGGLDQALLLGLVDLRQARGR